MPKTSWDDIESPLLQLAYPDATHYQLLTQWIFNIVKTLPKDKIHFIDSHEMVLDFLPAVGDFDLYNIDHHHDLGYGNEKKEEGASCADWVKVLYDQGRIHSYTWINNENSDAPLPETDKLVTKHIPLKNFQLSSLKDIDELYLCFSPPWIPPKWRALFFVWLDYCNSYFNTHFEIYMRKSQ